MMISKINKTGQQIQLAHSKQKISSLTALKAALGHSTSPFSYPLIYCLRECYE